MKKASNIQPKPGTDYQRSFEAGVKSVVRKIGVAAGAELALILGTKGATSNQFQNAALFYEPYMQGARKMAEACDPGLLEQIAGENLLESKTPIALPDSTTESAPINAKARSAKRAYSRPIVKSDASKSTVSQGRSMTIKTYDFVREMGLKSDHRTPAKNLLNDRLRADPKLQKYGFVSGGGFTLYDTPAARRELGAIVLDYVDRHPGSLSKHATTSKSVSPREPIATKVSSISDGNYVSIGRFVRNVGVKSALKQGSATRDIVARIKENDPSFSGQTRMKGTKFYTINDTPKMRDVATKLLEQYLGRDRRISEETPAARNNGSEGSGKYECLTTFVKTIGVRATDQGDISKYLRDQIKAGALNGLTRQSGQNYKVLSTSEAKEAALELLKGYQSSSGVRSFTPSRAMTAAVEFSSQDNMGRTYSTNDLATGLDIPDSKEFGEFASYAMQKHPAKFGRVLRDPSQNPLFTSQQGEMLRQMYYGQEREGFLLDKSTKGG